MNPEHNKERRLGEGQGSRRPPRQRRRRRLRGRGGVSREQRRIRGGSRRSIDGCNDDCSERAYSRGAPGGGGGHRLGRL
ncbi:hypothetical protein MTO96_042382 [Rhipicephalus appendiculatus]